jgi:condensin complex subunit 2
VLIISTLESRPTVQTQLELIPEPRKIEKQTINYAKVAKVVDVKALKRSMWKEMCSGGHSVTNLHNIQRKKNWIVKNMLTFSLFVQTLGQENHLSTTNSKDLDQQTMTTERTFQDIINAMPNYMPTHTLNDITVSYYFICLLHLANEKNLELQQTGLNDLTIRPVTTQHPK